MLLCKSSAGQAVIETAVGCLNATLRPSRAIDNGRLQKHGKRLGFSAYNGVEVAFGVVGKSRIVRISRKYGRASKVVTDFATPDRRPWGRGLPSNEDMSEKTHL